MHAEGRIRAAAADADGRTETALRRRPRYPPDVFLPVPGSRDSGNEIG